MPSIAVRPFSFEGTSIRTLEEGENIYFVASDIAKILSYRDADKLTRLLDEDEKGLHEVGTPGGVQRMLVVTESGLYKAILNRELGYVNDPASKNFVHRFQRWVTHEVLPSIRQHGGYMQGQEHMTPEQMALASMQWLQSKVNEQAQQIAQMAPKARALDDFTNTASSYSVNEAAKLLANAGVEIGQKSLFELMAEQGWVFRRESHWIANSERVKAGHLAMRAYDSHGKHADGSRFDFHPQVRITRRGLALLHQRLTALNLENILEAV